MKDRVRYKLRGPAAWVTLDRPDKLNAIDGPMVQALADALEHAADDDAVRVIVLRGAGRAFSAGFDLEDEDAADPADRHALRAELRRDFDLIMRCWDSPKPVIAAVHGYCLGGAFELMLACDLAVAADDCRLGAPELRFGSGIVALLLPWVVGPRRAREILLTATDRIDAATAERWGLVNRAVPAEHLETEAAKLALAVARSDPLAVRLTRDAIRAGCDRAGLREALADGLEACIEIEGRETEQSRRFYEIVRSQGTRAAAEWLDRQLGAAELAPAQEP